MFSQHRPIPMLRLLLPAASIAAAGLLTIAFIPKDETDYHFRMNKGLEVFGQVYREAADSYIDTVDPDAFIGVGIDAMLKTLDPYTVFQHGDATDVDLLTTGSYGGIGITVGLRDSLATVTDVVEGYSAQQKGMRIGDRLVSIAGHDISHGPVESLRMYTRGEAGTTVSVTVKRDGIATPLTFLLTRDNIKVHSVGFSRLMPDGIGYISLERFSATAGAEVRAALLDLKKQGNVHSIVLDLRDNPGGLLESAVDVVAQFLPAGSLVVSTRGRDTTDERIYRTHDEPTAGGIPLVVLVNDNSASASEIVAGAVQDLDAGVIVGTPSFGKGLVQTVHRLPYETSLKITTARYYTPSGRCIQKIDYATLRGDRPKPALPVAITFHTAHGRPVEQHGGIFPDTLVPAAATAAIVTQLRDASYFFKFATRFTAGYPTLPPDFAVTDRVIAEFTEFVLDTANAAALDSSSVTVAHQLDVAARHEGESPEVLRRIADVRTLLAADRRRLIETHREEIRRELLREIQARFVGRRERRSQTIGDDRQVAAAIGLLHGRDAYSRLLSVRSGLSGRTPSHN